MLFVLSPAKKLDYDSTLHIKKHTQPQFKKEAAALIDVLKQKSPAEIGKLMTLSPALSELNAQRYADWSPRFSASNSRQAVLAFNGDVYGGLQASSLSAEQLDWSQQHVAILSGLYGVLRPLDLMQPYRLEMGTKLKHADGKNLYDFWGSRISQALNKQLAQTKEGDAVLINLASEEYFKSVDTAALKARVVQCVFQEYKAGSYKVISFFAKRARGLMARYAIEHQAAKPQDLRKFSSEGYGFDSKASSDDRLVFRRKS